MVSNSPRPRRQLISTAQAAQELDVSPRTVRRYIATGRLRAFRVGPRMVKVDAADVADLARQVPSAEPRNSEGHTRKENR